DQSALACPDQCRVDQPKLLAHGVGRPIALGDIARAGSDLPVYIRHDVAGLDVRPEAFGSRPGVLLALFAPLSGLGCHIGVHNASDRIRGCYRARGPELTSLGFSGGSVSRAKRDAVRSSFVSPLDAE